ncbi:MAG: flagellar hook protein FlgE [Defluviitaleaceae bacterium]|nr:flagellar hook protein FlgE [Defluviitaleaceae bacterium]
MMRSLFSGVSGLRVHQGRMDVIGNNIANVNTIGFKSSRMTFADAMSQMVSGASADNPETGRAGVNPMQVGLGVSIGSIDNIMTQGSAQRTDRPMDLTIQGNGFFVVSDASGTFFTRAGNIMHNGDTFSIGGMQLMGWNSIEDPNNPGNFIIQQGSVQPLRTPPEMRFMDPAPTTMVDVMGNLNIRDANEDPDVPGTFILRRPVEFFDSIGNRYVQDVIFRFLPPGPIIIEAGVPDPASPDADEPDFPSVLRPGDWDEPPRWFESPSDNLGGVWTFEFVGSEPGMSTIFPDGDRRNPIQVETTIGPDEGTMGFIQFNTNGTLRGIGTMAPTFPGWDAVMDLATVPNDIFTAGMGDTVTGSQIGINFNTGGNPLLPPSVIGVPPDVDIAGNSGTITWSLAGIRQQSGMNTNLQLLFMDGNAPGTLEDISFGSDGIITGRFSNGAQRALGQIPLAVFLNPAGLERMGNNLWMPTANSGWFDGVGFVGDMMPGTLEMSNVDLSSEFTDMITTQRGFQANSRVITTSDELLQELVNLRR